MSDVSLEANLSQLEIKSLTSCRSHTSKLLRRHRYSNALLL
jgi:hypothetical protein